MSEDWDSECVNNPSPSFTLYQNNPDQSRRPKEHFLKYLRVVHGREVANRIRVELYSQKINENNFNEWKDQSLRKALYKSDNPPENLLRRRY